jgi:hypothetical protein
VDPLFPNLEKTRNVCDLVDLGGGKVFQDHEVRENSGPCDSFDNDNDNDNDNDKEQTRPAWK